MKPQDVILPLKGRAKLHCGDVHARNIARLKLHSAYVYGMDVVGSRKELRRKTLYTILTEAKMMLDSPAMHSNHKMINSSDDIYSHIALELEKTPTR